MLAPPSLCLAVFRDESLELGGSVQPGDEVAVAVRLVELVERGEPVPERAAGEGAALPETYPASFPAAARRSVSKLTSSAPRDRARDT